MGDEKTITAQQGTAKPPQRLRLSIWAGSHLVTPSSIKGAEKIIDDISLLKTLSVKTDDQHVLKQAVLDSQGNPTPIKKAVKLLAPLDVQFDPDVQPAPDTFYGAAIDACHQVGIQCLAGWDMARNDLPMQTMSLWFKDLHDGKFPDKDKEIDRVVQQILGFVNQDFHSGSKTVHFDGISFDMEQVAVAVADEAIAFYQAVADGLATATKDTNKFCGVAAGQLVDDTHSHFVRDAAGNITHQQQAIATAIAHRWSMAKDHALLVVRPMAYDDWPLTNLPPAASGATPGPGSHQQPPSVITQWHNDMMDFAAKTGVPPEQFQLGVKTFLGDANKPKLVEGPPGKFSWSGQDGCMTDPSELRRRCRELRKRGYGLILFAFPQNWGNVASYNFVLNANHSVPTAFDDKPSSASDPEFQKTGNAWDGTIPPATLGVPRQQPHTLNTLDRLKNA
jgi:hypothetical protein